MDEGRRRWLRSVADEHDAAPMLFTNRVPCGVDRSNRRSEAATETYVALECGASKKGWRLEALTGVTACSAQCGALIERYLCAAGVTAEREVPLSGHAVSSHMQLQPPLSLQSPPPPLLNQSPPAATRRPSRTHAKPCKRATLRHLQAPPAKDPPHSVPVKGPPQGPP